MNIKLPKYKILDIKNKPPQQSSWGIDFMSIPETWKVSEGENITILMLDSGIQLHEDMKNNILIEKCKDFTNENDIFDNGCYHGIHVAGICVAENNSFGCVGISPKSKLISVKVLNKHGSGSNSWVNKGLEYALKLAKNKEIDLVTMSLGGGAYDYHMHYLIKELYKLNIVCICASGNEGKDNSVNYPAKFKETICIGSIDPDDELSYYSSRGKEVDFVTPGSNIYSCWNNNTYALLSGTSMSCPAFSAICALLLSKHKKQELETGKNDCKTVEQIKEHFIKYAIDLGDLGKDNKYGWGKIDAINLIEDNSMNDSKPVEKELNWFQKIVTWFKKLF